MKKTLESLNTFLGHSPAGFNCDANTASTARPLQKQVLKHHVNNKKQLMLDVLLPECSL